jgi:hypothetical protein
MILRPRSHNLLQKNDVVGAAGNRPLRPPPPGQPTFESRHSPKRSLKKCFYSGCSKMAVCKACDFMRNEAYFPYAAMTNDEHNAADGCFSTADYGTTRRVVSTYHCNCRTIPRSSRTSFDVSPARVSRRFILPSAISGLWGFKKPISTKSVRR